MDAAPNGRRERALQELRHGTFDLLVIGGGINGAGIARDAAMRGLRVALVEKGDFASGTSSKSSKLVHGGVRYLQQRDFRLVRIACRERDLLRRRLAPHLVAPLAFVFPVYRNDPVGVFTLGVGMWIYDLLAAFRNIHRHKMLGPKAVAALEPALRREHLRGAALYYDCWTDDARLTLETALSARQEGGVVVNYLEVLGFLRANGHLVGAAARDVLRGTEFEVRARCIVNATGPWVDRVRRMDDERAGASLRLTKGAHVLVPRERVANTHAVVMHSPQDGRVLFVIPWESQAVIGTTDTDFAGSPDEVRADDADVAYLLDAANHYFPKARLGVRDVVSTYAGLRPLVASIDAAPSAVSREEAIIESASGLISLAGGKLTTYRFVAEEVVDRVCKKLGRRRRVRPLRAHRTARKPLPGGEIDEPQRLIDELVRADGHDLSPEQIEHLVHRYGSRAPRVLEIAGQTAEMRRRVVPGLPDIWAEVAFAAKEEMALQPEDVLLRRTKVGLKEPRVASQAIDMTSEIIEGRSDS